MKPSIQIRPANVEDVQIIHAFVSELEEMEFDFETFYRHFLHNISDTNNIYLVAEWQEPDKQNEMAGYLSCHGQLLLHHGGMVYEIQEMFVRKDFRSKGIGQLLIGALEERLNNRECLSLEVTTNQKRLATQEFYSRNGFVKTHVKFTKTRK